MCDGSEMRGERICFLESAHICNFFNCIVSCLQKRFGFRYPESQKIIVRGLPDHLFKCRYKIGSG